MSKPYRKTITRYVDATGKRCAKSAPGATRRDEQSGTWYGWVGGKDTPLCADHAKSKQMLSKLLADQAAGRLGMNDPFAEHRKRPLLEHVADYARDLAADGGSDAHVELVESRLRKLVEGCGFTTVADVSASAVNAWLAEQRKGPKFGSQTSNHYVTHVKGLMAWMVRDRRTGDNPLAHLDKLNIKLDVRHARRNLSPDELRSILTAARSSPRVFMGLTGEDRYMLYVAACATGFRASALASLTPESFSLDSPSPTVLLAARAAKNKRPKRQPLSDEVVGILRPFVAGKPAGERLWPGKWAEQKRAGTMLREDSAVAGVAYVAPNDDGDDGHADFHALRHTYLTELDRAGVSLVVMQRLAGHSTPVLTARYTHTNDTDMRDAVNRMPSLGVPQPVAGCGQVAGTPDAGCRLESQPGSDAPGKGEGIGAAETPPIPLNVAFSRSESSPVASGSPSPKPLPTEDIGSFQDRCNRPLCHPSGAAVGRVTPGRGRGFAPVLSLGRRPAASHAAYNGCARNTPRPPCPTPATPAPPAAAIS